MPLRDGWNVLLADAAICSAASLLRVAAAALVRDPEVVGGALQSVRLSGREGGTLTSID